MASRFNFFWKQLIPSSLNRSDLDVPFGKANYRSLFSDPLSEVRTASEDLDENMGSSCRTRRKRQKFESRCFEDVAG
ncbi:MAG: hypothetical protein JSR93_01595 [Verrucomicrobia bacterium]|nr:hypothetical protein [Verrucomicrobiota bacterium]